MMTTERKVTLKNDLSNWNPEKPNYWDKKTAWKTLIITTSSMLLCFMGWYVVSSTAPEMQASGFNLSSTQLYWLVAMPGLSGGFLRLVWTFLPPIVGTRRLITLSSLLMMIPLIGWMIAITNINTPYWLLLLLSFATGIGGGVFSGYMTSTSYFFPKAMQGTALGIQGGASNFGISFIQFLSPWIIGFALPLYSVSNTYTEKNKAGVVTSTKQVWLQNPALILLPLLFLCAVIAWLGLRSVPVKSNLKDQLDIFNNKHTWIMSAQYFVSAGSIAGLASVFALVVKNYFSDDYIKYAFLGAIVSSIARISWGPLCDKFGGKIWLLISSSGIAIFSLLVAFILNSSNPSFGLFLFGILTIFFFTGMGSAATNKHTPMLFPVRQAGGVIGWTASIAAFGPFIFGCVFSLVGAIWGFILLATLGIYCIYLVWNNYSRT